MRCRRGQALIEFAIIAFVLYLLLAATLELGRATFSVQTVQAAADLAAREISRTPLSVTYTSLNGSGDDRQFAALDDPTVRARIFDDRLLVIDLNDYPDPDFDFNALFSKFPVVNQQLRTLMIVDRSAAGRPLLRYPGAVMTKGSEKDANWPDLQKTYGVTDHGLRVLIPVGTLDKEGVGSVRWARVMEEINPDGFDVTPDPIDPSRPRGVVGVRINYPFQAAALGAYKPSDKGVFEPNGSNAILANDDGVTAGEIPDGRATASLDQDPDTGRQLQPNGGKFGLGSLLVGVPGRGGQRVRPFRRLLTGQAIYRREVFAP